MKPLSSKIWLKDPRPDTFWDYVRVKPSGCWEWLGKRSGANYGQLVLGIGKTMMLAHRMAWILTSAEDIPDGMYICHHCDNPPCVNPAHLFVGTPQDNVRDCMAKKRRAIPFSREATHCKHGHEFTPENTYWDRFRCRACKACVRAAALRRYHRLREAGTYVRSKRRRNTSAEVNC